MKNLVDTKENNQYNKKHDDRKKEYKKQARQKQSKKWVHI